MEEEKKELPKTEHWNESFYGKDLRGKDFSCHYFYKCNFVNAIADKTTNFRSSFFEYCDLSFMEAPETNWERSVRIHCDMTKVFFKGSNQKMGRLHWCDCEAIDFDNSDLRGLETPFSRFYNAKMRGVRFGGWSREIIAEIIRQNTTDLRVKQFAAWVKDETQLCWEQFMLLSGYPAVRDVKDDVIKILKLSGFDNRIENGAELWLS